MTRRTIFRLCVVLLLPALAVASAVVPQLSRPGGVSAQTAGSTVTLCGTVSAYTAPSPTTAGLITFSAPAATYAIAPGTTVTIAATNPFIGLNVCLVGLVGTASQLVGVSITGNSTPTSVVLCGIVGPITPATTTGTGAITIGGVLSPIAIGATAFTGVAVATGGNICLTATLNALGQITAGVAAANPTTAATTPVSFCGTLSAFTPAASSTTSATIAFSTPATTYTVAPGVTVGNTTLAAAGNLVCLVGQTNGTQLTSVSFVPLLTTTVTVCGPVTAYTLATTTTAGSVTVNGTVLTLAPNLVPSGIAISTGLNLCFVATLNTLQQATALAVSVNQVTTVTPTVTTTPTTATPTTTVTATATATAATVTPTATVNVPPPPPPPGATATATATVVAATATATATAAPATATPVPPVATPTPKPAKTPKPKPTATTAPPVAPAPAPATPVPAPSKLPSTGFGGGSSAFAHNASVGRAFRAANGNVAAPLGIASQPASGGSDPISPAVPAILGLAAIGLGVLARKFGIARR